MYEERAGVYRYSVCCTAESSRSDAATVATVALVVLSGSIFPFLDRHQELLELNDPGVVIRHRLHATRVPLIVALY
jgi:hypothetical protein